MNQDVTSNNKPHSKRLARELTMQFLFQCDLAEEEPTAVKWEAFLQQATDTHNLVENRYARKGRSYGGELLNIVQENRAAIDKMILAHISNWSWDRLALVDRNVMRVAVAEMLFVPDVPPVVSISEAVEIARDYSGDAAGNFINGVLNSVKNDLDRPERKAVEHL